MKDLEKNLKALANRRRLAILHYLKNRREASVNQIANEIKLSIKATSKHLGILSAVDMVDTDKRSLNVFYRLATRLKPETISILNLL